MQILGHDLIAYKPLHSVSSIEEISQSPEENTLLFEYKPELIKYAKNHNKSFALHIFNQEEAIIGNGSGAKILICPLKIAQKVQEIAEYYLFDAKVAILINSEEEISLAIAKKVDMAILPDAII
ncbi:MAG: hypothetical protein CR967_05985 [Proteobacteria bacterium]|nr:MAG: hypothetical protein CR967_05985 [Pseudomonadota bacterium]